MERFRDSTTVLADTAVLRVLLDSLVRAPHSQRVVSMEPMESTEPTEQRAE